MPTATLEPPSLLLCDVNALNEHITHGHIFVSADGMGSDCLYRIHHIHALDDGAEYGIARIGTLGVEESVIGSSIPLQ